MTFETWLEKYSGVPQKKLSYYSFWVDLYHGYESETEHPTSEGFQKSLLSHYSNWQIHQAEEAVRFFKYYMKRQGFGDSTRQLRLPPQLCNKEF